MNKFKQTTIVTQEQTAIALGSGTLPVFATPAMIAFMENTAMNHYAPSLKEGTTTVGIEMSTTHEKASIIGEEITCESEITQIDGRKIQFSITCFNKQNQIIGRATHSRFVVDIDKFMSTL